MSSGTVFKLKNKDYMWHDSIYMTVWKRPNRGNKMPVVAKAGNGGKG